MTRINRVHAHDALKPESILGERAIRSQLLANISTKPGLVVEEMGLLRGEYRVDVALVSNYLAGFEIKSERDNLDRLPRQRRMYGRIFDYVTLVTTERHVRAARKMIPRWWGIWLASTIDDRIRIEEVRVGAENTSLDPMALVQLLWREEARVLLARWGIEKTRSKTRDDLCRMVVSVIPPSEIRSIVLQTLRQRTTWRFVS